LQELKDKLLKTIIRKEIVDIMFIIKNKKSVDK